MVDYRVLQAQLYVAIVAEEGSFSRAAKRLRTAQSFLAKRVSEAERDLKTKIFERSTRKVELTEAGRLIVSEVEQALQHAERAWDIGHYYGRLMNGPIRLGCSLYTQGTLLRRLHLLDLAKFEAQRIADIQVPGPNIVFEHSVTPDLIDRVLKGRLHASLGILPIQNHELWVAELNQEPFCVCVPKGHELALRPTIAVRDLDGQRIFWMPRTIHPQFYDRTVEYIAGLGAQPNYQEIGSISGAIEIVVHGIGIALLPNSATRLAQPGAVFKTVSDRYLRIETALFARRELMRGAIRDLVLFIFTQLNPAKPNTA